MSDSTARLGANDDSDSISRKRKQANEIETARNQRRFPWARGH